MQHFMPASVASGKVLTAMFSFSRRFSFGFLVLWHGFSLALLAEPGSYDFQTFDLSYIGFKRMTPHLAGQSGRSAPGAFCCPLLGIPAAARCHGRITLSPRIFSPAPT
jgi:hypothetical protein